MNIEETYGGQWSSDPALLKTLLDAGHTIICHDLNCKPIEAFLYDGEYWFDTGEDRYKFADPTFWPVLKFLDPRPRGLEPSPLEWKHLEMNEEAIAVHGDWAFYAWNNGGWMVSFDGICMRDGQSGTELNEGDFDTAKAAIHEWRVNLLKSIIGGK